jgi:hypothetical protein
VAIIVAIYTLLVSVCYTLLALSHPTVADALTVPFVALLLVPCLWLNYVHLKRDRDA